MAILPIFFSARQIMVLFNFVLREASDTDSSGVDSSQKQAAEKKNNKITKFSQFLRSKANSKRFPTTPFLVDYKEHAIGKNVTRREPWKEVYLMGNLTQIQRPNLFGIRSFRLTECRRKGIAACH